MKTKVLAAMSMVMLALTPVSAKTIKDASYIGVILLRENRVVDLFAIDQDGSSIFHGGGLRTLNKNQMEILCDKLRPSIMANKVDGSTKLFDGIAAAIEILGRESPSLPENAAYKLVIPTDGFDTTSKKENTLAKTAQLIGAGINGSPISVYGIAVRGNKGSANAVVLETLAGKNNVWSIDNEELTQRILLEITQSGDTGQIPVIMFVIDQSDSLKSQAAKIEKAVEITVRALFEKTDNCVLIPGGMAGIGSPESEQGRDEDEALFHTRIAAFDISPWLFTQREYEAAWGPGSNPSAVKGPGLPVTNISFYRMLETLNKLSEQKGYTPAYKITKNGDVVSVEWDKTADGYRLATEAEWEYACRAGTTTPFYTGAAITKDQANINGNAPTPVGSYPPNGFGLFDMIGNVKEFVWDVYGRYPTDDGDVFEAVGNERVTRGGSYANRNDFEFRSAYRTYDDPHTESPVLGFRIARNSD
ncbi:MAG: formylglycine-generating enzyme family protein [Treponema sp.]|jgi:formylglycine-generating enzyme required for sulfatase activity|nr:formylglycine-generating enzyme family protein [Treponema sp.]